MFRTVCSIRWLQSALIPFITTQSVGVLNRANKIVDYFMHFFRKHTNNIIIVSNVFKVKEYNLNNSNINNYIKYIEKYLIDFGYIETISASIYDNDNCLSLGFKKFLTTDYDVIAMFSLLMMMDEGIDGHCFLFLMN